MRLSWSHVGQNEITIATDKSGRRVEAIIPLYDDLRTLIASIPKYSTTILTSSHRRPWTADGFESSFYKAKERAGMNEQDLNFNDLRGTAATRFYNSNLPIRVIAEMLGWKESKVERIIRRYVTRASASMEVIRQMNKAKAGT